MHQGAALVHEAVEDEEAHLGVAEGPLLMLAQRPERQRLAWPIPASLWSPKSGAPLTSFGVDEEDFGIEDEVAAGGEGLGDVRRKVLYLHPSALGQGASTGGRGPCG